MCVHKDATYIHAHDMHTHTHTAHTNMQTYTHTNMCAHTHARTRTHNKVLVIVLNRKFHSVKFIPNWPGKLEITRTMVCYIGHLPKYMAK